LLGYPSYDIDLFSDSALAEPYGHYKAIRALGPVVCLGAHDLLAISRYAEARNVLGNPTTYCSGDGVGLNDVVNEMGKGNTLTSDGELHSVQREVVERPVRKLNNPIRSFASLPVRVTPA
jgi:cytochrome P450